MSNHETTATSSAAEGEASLLEQTQRQVNLTSDLSALTSLMSRAPRMEWVSISSLSREVWEDLDADGATLRTTSTPEVRGDREWVGLLLRSLFENMVTHAGPDVVVEVGLDDGRLYVADDGPGIPIESRDRVLESGYSSSDTGSGFGLSVVKHAARAHDWGLRLRESADGGVRFECSGLVVDESTRPTSRAGGAETAAPTPSR